MQLTQSHQQQRLAPIEALASQGHLDEALAQIVNLVRDEPGFVDAHNDMAVLYHAKGDLEAAFTAIKQAIALAPDDANVQRNHAAIEMARGRPAAAARALEGVLTKNPKDGEALALAGDVAMITASYDDAITFYQTAVTANPSLTNAVREKLTAAQRGKIGLVKL